MFDTISDAAEKLASKVSRRDFFGSLGRWAGASALALAGVLATAGTGRAGGNYICCYYGFYVPGGSWIWRAFLCIGSQERCPSSYMGYTRYGHAAAVGNCRQCPR